MDSDATQAGFVHSYVKKFTSYWRSYSPLLVFFSTVKPAFFASLMESGLRMEGVLKLEMIFCTGRLQAGHLSSGLADTGRRSVKPGPPHGLQSPLSSHSSYS